MLDANQDILEKKRDTMVIFSMDVRALYPSLDIEVICEAVVGVILTSKLQVKNLNAKEMCKYLAITLDKEEIEKRNLGSHIRSRTVNWRERQRRSQP